MHTLHYQNKEIKVAENFNDLSGRQLTELMEVIHKGKTKLQQQIDALRILCNRSKLLFFMLKPECIDAFLPYAAWALGENTLTRQLLPAYDELHGPSDELANLRMKEFHFTEQYYKNYMEEGKAEDLNMLIATMYRPAVKSGFADRPIIERLPFDDAATPFYAKRVAEWPLALRQAILFYYDGCRQHIIALYDVVFSGESESQDEQVANYGMYGLMMELAGEKLGTVHQVEDMYVHTALASLEIMILKAQKLAADQEAAAGK